MQVQEGFLEPSKIRIKLNRKKSVIPSLLDRSQQT